MLTHFDEQFININRKSFEIQWELNKTFNEFLLINLHDAVIDIILNHEDSKICLKFK